MLFYETMGNGVCNRSIIALSNHTKECSTTQKELKAKVIWKGWYVADVADHSTSSNSISEDIWKVVPCFVTFVICF